MNEANSLIKESEALFIIHRIFCKKFYSFTTYNYPKSEFFINHTWLKGDHSLIKYHNNLFQLLYSKRTYNDIFLKVINNRAEKRKPHSIKYLTSQSPGDEFHF